MSRKNYLKDSTYAKEFKPAILFGGPSLDEMVNVTYLEEHKEKVDVNGGRTVFSTDLAVDENQDAQSIFTVQTIDPAAKPRIIKVGIHDPKVNYDFAFVMEPEPFATGISVVLLTNTTNKDQEVYVNTYVFPYSKFDQLVARTVSGVPQVSLKQDERIKLQVTVKPSSTGEPTFKTHDTEVSLSGIDEATRITMLNQLEFDIANQVAHLSQQLIEINPNQDVYNPQNLNATMYLVTWELPNWINRKTLILGATALCTAAAGVVGVITAPVTAGAVVAGLAATGGFTRAIVGIWGALNYGSIENVVVDQLYDCEINGNTQIKITGKA